MPIVSISAASDPRVSAYRNVPDPELVRARGFFVAEGRLVVRRVIEDRRFSVQSVLVSEAARRSLEPFLSVLSPEVPIYVCHRRDFLDLTGYNIHRGCLALVERPPEPLLDEVVRAARVVVVVEGVTNADNIGGVFRNAAAFGADAVLLSPTSCDPLYRKAIRTSMAATLRLPFARVEEWPEGLEQLRASAFTIVGLTPREPAMALDAFVCGPRTPRIAL